MIKLRPYQDKAIKDIHSCFSDGIKSALVTAPTGSGKTVIFSELARRVSLKNNKVLVLTDRSELLTQAGGSFKRVGLESFYIEAGCKRVSNSFNTYIAMSQTLRRRMDDKYWRDFITTIDLIIIDEAHKQEFNWLFENDLDLPHILGFTATPKRSGKMRQLGLDYEKIIETVEVQQLIDMGYLMSDDYYGLNSPDTSNIEIDRMTGDYKVNQMFQKFNSPTLYKGVVKNYLDLVNSTKSLVFCVNIEHCINTVLEFKNNGLDVKFLVSKVSKPKEPDVNEIGKYARYLERKKVYDLYTQYFDVFSGKRNDVLNWFSTTKGAILVNAGILTTGYDESTIETIILNRATISVTLLLQMLGRGSRINDSKTHFNILDFGGNCNRLGHYTEKRQWSLWHESTSGKGLPPVKECGFNSQGMPIKNEGKKGCRRLIMASMKICPFCGFRYPEKKLKEINLTGTAFDTELQRAVKIKRIKDMSHKELYTYWKMKKYKSAWLWRQLWYKGGELSIRNFGYQYGWSHVTQRKAINFCKNVL